MRDNKFLFEFQRETKGCWSVITLTGGLPTRRVAKIMNYRSSRSIVWAAGCNSGSSILDFLQDVKL